MSLKISLFTVLFFLSFLLQAQTYQPEYFQNLNIRNVGPANMSGRITAIDVVESDTRIIYLGAASGGVWKSENGGTAWKSIFDDQPTQNIGALAVQQDNPSVIWVGTGEGNPRNSVNLGQGLFRSLDAGESWQFMGLEATKSIHRILVDPQDGDVVYVGAHGDPFTPNEHRGVYKTTDGGESWQKILYTNEQSGVADMVMDPENPNKIFVAMYNHRRTPYSFTSGGPGSGLFVTYDGGKNWQQLGPEHGLPEGELGRIGIAIAPSNPKRVYAKVEATTNALYRSEDGGKSWKMINDNPRFTNNRPFYFQDLAVDPQDPDRLYNIYQPLTLSYDGGLSFDPVPMIPADETKGIHADFHAFWVDPNDPDYFIIGGDGGIGITHDKGESWYFPETIPVAQFYHIAVDNEMPYNVYGGMQDNGNWSGPGYVWKRGGIRTLYWQYLVGGDGFYISPDSANARFGYGTSQNGDLYRYDKLTGYYQSIQPKTDQNVRLRFNWDAGFARDLNDQDVAYYGSQFVHKTTDRGKTWQIISPDLTTNDPDKQNQSESGGLSVDNSGAENHTTIFTIGESPLDENVIWVGTDDGNVQLTTDGGENWENVVGNVPDLPANTWVYHIEPSSHNKGTAYAVFEGHQTGDKRPYLYKTTDFGQSWTSLVTDDISGFARSVQEDFVNPDLLFLGTEFGLYVTIDGGTHWSKFTNNMPNAAVHHITLQKQTSDLVMGTHGRGVIIIDDISPLREITQEVLAKDLHFFSSDPFVINEESGFGGHATEREFVGPNPPSNAQIIYYLKKRHIFGKMTLEVQDMEGNTLTELGAGKSKGINVATWAFKTRQPKIAKGASFAYGGFTAPRVLPGTYKVVLNKGKDRYETEIELKPDPNSLLTEEERKEHYQTTLKLFNMTEELAYMVYEIDAWLDAANEVKEMDRKGRKAAEPFIEELMALKETLVVTEGDNYVGRQEPQLRGKLADLYSKIASGFQPPSPSEQANMELMEDTFTDAKNEYASIQKKELKKLKKYMEKNEISAPELKSYEEFVEG